MALFYWFGFTKYDGSVIFTEPQGVKNPQPFPEEKALNMIKKCHIGYITLPCMKMRKMDCQFHIGSFMD